MKKILIYALMAAMSAVAVCSCSKDDDKSQDEIYAEKLSQVPDWYGSQVKWDGTEDYVTFPEGELKFKSDGTFSYSAGMITQGETYTGRYTIKDGKVTATAQAPASSQAPYKSITLTGSVKSISADKCEFENVNMAIDNIPSYVKFAAVSLSKVKSRIN